LYKFSIKRWPATLLYFYLKVTFISALAVYMHICSIFDVTFTLACGDRVTFYA